jgi:hypothetical protein
LTYMRGQSGRVASAIATPSAQVVRARFLSRSCSSKGFLSSSQCGDWILDTGCLDFVMSNQFFAPQRDWFSHCISDTFGNNGNRRSCLGQAACSLQMTLLSPSRVVSGRWVGKQRRRLHFSLFERRSLVQHLCQKSPHTRYQSWRNRHQPALADPASRSPHATVAVTDESLDIQTCAACVVRFL